MDGGRASPASPSLLAPQGLAQQLEDWLGLISCLLQVPDDVTPRIFILLIKVRWFLFHFQGPSLEGELQNLSPAKEQELES